jgi:hypothetical protein
MARTAKDEPTALRKCPQRGGSRAGAASNLAFAWDGDGLATVGVQAHVAAGLACDFVAQLAERAEEVTETE